MEWPSPRHTKKLYAYARTESARTKCWCKKLSVERLVDTFSSRWPRSRKYSFILVALLKRPVSSDEILRSRKTGSIIPPTDEGQCPKLLVNSDCLTLLRAFWALYSAFSHGVTYLMSCLLLLLHKVCASRTRLAGIEIEIFNYATNTRLKRKNIFLLWPNQV